MYKISSKSIQFVLKILRKNTFLQQSRAINLLFMAITLLFINEFSTFAIPNHFSPVSISMQKLQKIDQKLLKLGSGNEALTDGHSNGSEGKPYYPTTSLWRGIKRQQTMTFRNTYNFSVENHDEGCKIC